MSYNKPITVKSLEKICVDNGLRMTSLRRCMLSILVNSVEHLTVIEVIEQVLSSSLNINLASIYRNMLVFEKIGILRSHTVKTPQIYYEVVGSVPDHFIDLDTGKARELHHKALDVFKAAIVEQYGYKKEDCYLRLYAYPKAPL
ncbi:MAG: hypothetical protein COA96_01330 [SAR86 cluster bacterium]|uniref:Transcriptional repressor n=1 Tax=SAR86 cluster bacterium TaxID=2030880 RepID=A0A2A5B9H6_9GAMM|nr:MAG: hypothetical protein COA96_01330 [SAR86 cluster bacterium]